MVRAQVQFTEEPLAALRGIASQEGVSISRLVSEGVKLLLRDERGPSREQLVRRSVQAVGLSRSGTGDLSARHDGYLDDAGEQ